jgi:ribose transport system permease protein
MAIRAFTIDREQIRRQISRQYYPFSLLLLLVVILINSYLQANFYKPAVLNGFFRTILPLVILSAGQTVVIVGGGIDLSSGAIASLVNVIMASLMGVNASPSQVVVAVLVGLVVGALAGAVNGFCVAYLRFQPLVTTFATTSIFSGIALFILPVPGGGVPEYMIDIYSSHPLGIPLAAWAILLVFLAWLALRSTSYGRYLNAVGGNSISAYMSGVPVARVQFSMYMFSGLMAGVCALALTLTAGTGDPLIGGGMTLNSIVAVVLGGTSLAGGAGGVGGSLMGAFIISIIHNLISFANISNWWQTLAYGLIVVFALVGPGMVNQLRKRQ